MKIPNLTQVYDTTVPGNYETEKFVFFWSGPFSNWHPSPFKLRGIMFNCSEQAMMYLKAIEFGDTDSAQKILQTKDPAKQKAYGRAVKGYDEARWVEIRERISDEFLYAKFEQNYDLCKVLLDTEDKIIVEASPYDEVWGIAMGVDKYPEIMDPANWKGANLLGESLMRVRDSMLDDLEYESRYQYAMADIESYEHGR